MRTIKMSPGLEIGIDEIQREVDRIDKMFEEVTGVKREPTKIVVTKQRHRKPTTSQFQFKRVEKHVIVDNQQQYWTGKGWDWYAGGAKTWDSQRDADMYFRNNTQFAQNGCKVTTESIIIEVPN